jgi:flavin-dependent dehydrogenase
MTAEILDSSIFQVIVVGGGIGGSAAALRAVQHFIRTA